MTKAAGSIEQLYAILSRFDSRIMVIFGFYEDMDPAVQYRVLGNE